MTVLEMAAAIRARRVSSAELVETALKAIDRLDGRLNAFITVTAAQARAAARQRDEELRAGRNRGPLHGVPIAHKDIFLTRGVRTTAGSRLWAEYVPDFDATVVERLEAAGAVSIGKTGLHEHAYGITSNNPHYGPIHNPWNTASIPGGSSGGSAAAVAAGIVPFATGTDTGGSIRVPASFCGITGIKPTFGRVSKYGVMPLGYTLDHMGPLTRTVRDTAVALQAMAGRDPRDPTCTSRPVPDFLPPAEPRLEGVKIGLPGNFFFDAVHPDVEAGVQRMTKLAAEAGAAIVPVRVPDIVQLNVVARTILLAEAASVHEPHAGKRDLYGADVLALLDQGRLLPATAYLQAQRVRRRIRADFTALFRQVDLLFVPATPTPAPGIGQVTLEIRGVTEDVRLATTRLVRSINALGLPALSIPCGFTADMPLGMQIIGRPFEEPLVLRAGAALEDRSGLLTRRPPA